MTLRMRITNKPKFDRNINDISKKTLRNIRNTVRISANDVRNEAITSITSNPR